jgi:ABC-2 type transport system permease protein
VIGSAEYRSPVAVVAAKERLELRRDGRWRLALGLVTGLLVLAAVTGWRTAAAANREVEQAAAADRAAWLGQGARNPHTAAHFGQYAFRPLSPLAFVDRGVDTYIGRAIWMEAHSQDPARHRAAEDRTALARLGEPSAASVLQVLVPLVLVLLAFGAVAGERETGTWRQVLAQGVSPPAVALGKMLGLGSAVALPLGIAALVGAVALGVSGGGQPLPGQLARYVVLVAGYGLFFVGFLGLALAVSALARSRRVALLALFGLWVVTTTLVPRLLADWTERLTPVPPAGRFWAQIAEDKEKGIDGHDPADERAKAFEREVLARYGVEKLEDLPVSFDGLAMQAGEEHGNQVFDRRWGEVWDAYQRQERWQTGFGLVAPQLALRGLSMAMAGTDLAHHRHFAQAAESHRRVINRQLNEHFAQNAGRESWDWKADPAFWATVPEFVYQPPALPSLLAARWRELLVLAGWALLGPALAVFAARRAAAAA